MAESGLFLHVDLGGCGLALGRLAKYAECLGTPAPVAAGDWGRGPTPLPSGLPPVLTEHRAKSLLAELGLPIRRGDWQRPPHKPPKLQGPRFPVALKVQSPDITHKTEAGAVRLGLADPAQWRTRTRQSLPRRQPSSGARIDGVLLQRMAPPGHELVVGMVNDATFGPIMMVGWGGVMVELMGDVAHRPAPVDRLKQPGMLGSLRFGGVAAWLPRRRARGHDATDGLVAQLSVLAIDIAIGSLRLS